MKSYQELWQSLTPLYETSEAQSIVRLVLEVKYGMTLTDIIGGKVNELSADEGKKLEEIIERLQNAEPVQYVLGQADFMGMTFHVEPGVLIPRPETAELCQWIIDYEKEKIDFIKKKWNPLDYGMPLSTVIKGLGLSDKVKGLSTEDATKVAHEYWESGEFIHRLILDFCTGSGCIATTLNFGIKNSKAIGIDISDQALKIAELNAKQLEAPSISFRKENVLSLSSSFKRLHLREELLGDKKTYCDIIVCNPPYICEKEKADMARNVLEYEPSLALFVPDKDPLLFYRAVAKIGKELLHMGGMLYFEVNPLYADDIKQMLEDMEYIEVVIKEDSFGKKRMIRAKRDAD